MSRVLRVGVVHAAATPSYCVDERLMLVCICASVNHAVHNTTCCSLFLVVFRWVHLRKSVVRAACNTTKTSYV